MQQCINIVFAALLVCLLVFQYSLERRYTETQKTLSSIVELDKQQTQTLAKTSETITDLTRLTGNIVDTVVKMNRK